MEKKKMEKKVVSTYKKIENGVVDGYKKIEDGVVGTYKKIEDKFVGTFLEEDKQDADNQEESFVGRDRKSVV